MREYETVTRVGLLRRTDFSSALCARGKGILEQLSKPRFNGVRKSRAFLRCRGEKGAIFKLRKKMWLFLSKPYFFQVVYNATTQCLEP